MTTGDKRDVIITVAFYIAASIWLFINKYCGLSLVVCPVKKLFNVPCPGCGITCASGLLLDGHLFDAIAMNPNVVLVIPWLIVYPVLLFVRIRYNNDLIAKVMSCLELKRVYIPLVFLEIMVRIHNIESGL